MWEEGHFLYGLVFIIIMILTGTPLVPGVLYPILSIVRALKMSLVDRILYGLMCFREGLVTKDRAQVLMFYLVANKTSIDLCCVIYEVEQWLRLTFVNGDLPFTIYNPSHIANEIQLLQKHKNS